MESKTSYDPPSWISPFFQKRQETMGINIKSSQNAYEMRKFVNLRNLTMKTGKKNTKLSQKVDFSQTYGIQ